MIADDETGLRRLVCATTTILCMMTASAHAAPGKTTWTGYLYQGPGLHYSVVDEFAQATDLDVVKCAKEWCEVRLGDRTGYVLSEIVSQTSLDRPPAGVLAQPAASVRAASPSGPCFDANQKGGNGGNAMTIFCRND